MAGNALLLALGIDDELLARSVVEFLLAHCAQPEHNQPGFSPPKLVLGQKENGDAEDFLINPLHPASLEHSKKERCQENEPPSSPQAYQGHDQVDVSNDQSASVAHDQAGEKKAQESAYIDQETKDGETALYIAIKVRCQPVAKSLIGHGAKVSTGGKDGHCAFLLAAEKGYHEVLKVLLMARRESISQDQLDKALLLAAREGRTEAAVLLHENNAKSGIKGREAMTALHWAIENKNEHLAGLLIGALKDGNIDPEDQNHRTPLSMASGAGLKTTVDKLLGKGADARHQDGLRRTALHWAAMGHHDKIVEGLLNAKQSPDVNNGDNQGRTALHCAAYTGASNGTETIRLLLDAKAYPYSKDTHKQTPLILAARKGHLSAVKKLLDTQCDWEALDEDKRTALDWAAAEGFEKVVAELLLKFNEDSKKSALDHAAKNGHFAIVAMLFNSIKQIAIRNSAMNTILFAAAATTRLPESLDRLISSATDVNPRDGLQRRTPLMLAVKSRNRQLIDKLLDLKAQTDLQDADGTTALMTATRVLDEQTVQALLLAHANPDLQDNQKYTALHYAVETGDNPCLQHLVKYGITSANILDSKRRTALHIAMENLETGDEPSSRRYRRYCRLYPDLARQRDFWQYLLALGHDCPDSGFYTLAEKTDLHLKDERSQTPLHLAIRKDQINIAILFLQRSEKYDMDVGDTSGRTPLLLAAEKGSDLMVLLLLVHQFKHNVQDKADRTALLLTAERGALDSVIALLDAKADPNIPDSRGRTPLSVASQNGHEEVVSTLIKRAEDLTLDSRDWMGRTALMLAAENGHKPIVDLLLGHKANTTITDYNGKKAWEKAMEKGHADVVRLLLSEPDAPVQDRKSVNDALLLASRRGCVELVGVLLEQGANATFQNDKRWTALHLAAMNGHHKVVEILIKKGTDISLKDGTNRTALMRATEYGFESIVSLLLENKDDKNEIDEWMGREALLFAAERGYAGIVDLLIKNEIDHNHTDSTGRTAMSLAAMNGNSAIVQTLLEAKADSAIKDKHDRTALHFAAWGGHSDVVEVLLEHGADVSASDKSGQLPLHPAAERASERVIKQIVGKGANINAKSRNDGQTALHRAAWGGSLEIVKLLRECGADSFIRDDQSKKPWQVAAEKGHESIVEALLKDEESVSEEKILRKKALIFAGEMGCPIIAQALIEKGADPSVKDGKGRTALHWAAKRGNGALVDLLVKRDESLLNVLDPDRQTALCLAVLEGNAVVVEKLLHHGADANIQGENKQTVLHQAAKMGNWEIVQVLVKHGADPHARDCDKKKAWELAAKEGYHQIVRHLLEKEVDYLLGKEVDLKLHHKKKEEFFLQMVEQGSLPMVQLLLDKGVDVNARDRHGKAAIGLAVENRKDDVLRLLLSKGADPNLTDSKKRTPLLWAAKTGNTKAISLLLEQDYTGINHSEEEGEVEKTAEEAGEQEGGEEGGEEHGEEQGGGHGEEDGEGPSATKEDEIDQSSSDETKTEDDEGLWKGGGPGVPPGCRDPLEQGSDGHREEQTHGDDRPSMNLDASLTSKDGEGEPSKSKASLGSKGTNGRDTNDGTSSGLNNAGQDSENEGRERNEAGDIRTDDEHHNTDVSEEQVVQSSDDGAPSSRDGEEGGLREADESDEDPPIEAGSVNNEAIESTVKRTFRYELVNSCDYKGRTALLIAIGNKQDNAARILLSKGAPDIDVNLHDELKRAPLHLAAERGNRLLVQSLLEAGANRYHEDQLGQTALFPAVESGKMDIVNLLVGDGNSEDLINTCDKQNQTVLHVATDQGNIAILQKLLDSGANPNRKDKLGRTALLIATENGEKDMVHVLLGKNADVNTEMLRQAVANGDKEVVETLFGQLKTHLSTKDLQSLLDLARKSGNKEVTFMVAQKLDLS
ncbi:uncharacterized protein E0L32_009778 [Thyridium curvatum]|uniref:Uncharacterized protein n=1 Tax=Thyridium curvatum TaxID=1093900 RepID=A0A507APR5_9PEZI|nr:uncharacterized protein E0L32_009778 [Thyridium curvatum]TPX08716.1 hypothetical protein E0L32_009778 [Thyridium curvatum]